MKIFIAAILAVLALAAQPAAARQWRDFGGGAHFDVQGGQRQRPGGFQRQQPQRDFRGPERDFRGPERMPDRRDGRMTDEERRNLHRDLDRANREIYKGR
jgi:hypothetical protein